MNKRLFWVITSIIILLLWAFQFRFSVNIPWWDDFHGVILPVYDLFTNIPIVEKLKGLTSLNNEHRVLNDRIFMLIIYLITGKFELKALVMLGFINLIIIFFLFFKILKKKNIPLESILPIVFLLFQAQFYESLQYLMIPFQNFSVLLYMLLSIYFLTFKRNILWGLVLALAALYSHGNGILVFILGFLILLIQQNYKRAGFWFLFSTLAVSTYFIGYHKPNWVDEATISPLTSPIAALRYVFEFLGAYSLNIVELSTSASSSILNNIVPQIFGLAAFSFFVYIILRKYPLKKLKTSLESLKNENSDQFFLATGAFFIATAIIMGLTRTGFTIQSRYTINSCMFLMIVYGFYITNHKIKNTKLINLTFFVILVFSYFNSWVKAEIFNQNVKAEAINYKINGSYANSYSDSSHVSRLNPLIVEPLKAGKYTFPEVELDDFPNWKAKTHKELLNYGIENNFLMISGENDNQADQIFFTLESEDYKFIFPTQSIRNDPKTYILSGKYYTQLYRGIFPINVVPKRNYDLYKIEKSKEGYKKIKLGRTLTTQGMII